MYERKQVIRKTKEMSDKTYQRRLFGRVFTLHRMIEKRGLRIGNYRKEIDGYMEEIRSLERKIGGVKKDISKVRSENKEIQNEIKSYREVIERYKDNGELKYKPSFSVRKITRGGYDYLEGRIRLPMVEGRVGKVNHHSFGRFEKVVEKYERQVEKFPEGMRDEYKLFPILTWLEKDLEERWWNGIELLGE